MRKTLSFLLLTILIFSIIYIQSSNAEDKPVWTWVKAYGGKYADKSGQMVIAPDGGYVIYGQTYDPKNLWELFVMKIDKKGKLKWSKVYSKSKNETAISYTNIHVTKDGGFIIATMSDSFGEDYDLVVLKLDKDGNIEWQKVFIEKGVIGIWDIIQTSDGGYLIGGGGDISEKNKNYAFVIKLNSKGNLKWAKGYKLSFGQKDYEAGLFLYEDSEKNLIFSGRNYQWQNRWICNPTIIKTDSNGNVKWAEIINCGSNYDGGDKVLEAHDGGYVVGGWTYSLGAGDQDFLMYKVNVNGDLEWIKSYGGYKKDRAVFISKTNSGYAMSGYTNSFRDDGWDILYFETFKNGDIKWVKKFGGNKDKELEDRYGTILQTDDSGFIIDTFLNSFGNNGLDVVVLKTNSEGEIPNCSYIKDVKIKVKDYTNSVKVNRVNPLVLDFTWQEKDADFVVKDINFSEFTICEPPPSNVNLLSPSNGEILNILTPTLSWTESVNADYHKVQISDRYNFSNIVFEKDLYDTEITIPEGVLKDGYTYYWRVKGVNALSEGNWSNIYSFKINIVNPPSKPENLEVSQIDEGVKLTWSSSNQGTYPIYGYEIFKGESIDNFVQIAKVSNTSYIDKDVYYGKTYYYKIRAFDTNNNYSEFSNIVSIRIEDIFPPKVDILTPEDNSYTNKEIIKLNGIVSDLLSGVYKLLINNEEINFDENGEFNKDIVLIEGINKITVEAIDKAGNKTQKTISILLDKTPPEILVSIPEETYEETIKISGRVKDNLSNVESLKINGKLVNLLPDGSFTYNITLFEGENSIIIEATDKLGNINQKTFTIKYIKRIILKLQIGNKIMYVNENTKEIDVPPTIVEGRTYLPIRWITEPLGANLSWVPNEKKVKVELKGTVIELWIGKNIARVNGVDTPIDPNNPKVVPMIINGRTMLPVRFVAENLGCKVQWDSITKTITIIYPGE